MSDESFKELEKNFQLIHSELNSNLPKGMIYHYTSYDALTKIIEQRKLRCTDYRYFNDPTELKYGQNIIIEALLKSNISRDLVALSKRFFDNFDQYYQIYVSCFTEEIKKLALWRYYASNGSGFAIGFNQNFQKIIEPSNTVGKATIYKIIYDEDNSQEIVNRFIKEFASSSINRQSFIVLITHLISLLPMFKDKSFKDENEVRFVYIEGEGVADPNTQQPFFFDEKYRDFIPITKRDTPFVNTIQGNKAVIIPEKFDRSHISEVWVGPSCEFLEARNWIISLLTENKYKLKKIKIQQSQLPY